MIEGILQVLVGGILALGGAFVGPHFQRNHERWKAKREDEQLIREKAQALFDELDRLSQQSAASMNRAVERLGNQSLDLLPFPDLGPIRAIAAIYFPSTLPRIASFEEEYGEHLRSIVTKITDAFKANQSDADFVKGMTVLMLQGSQMIASKFVRDMRGELAEMMPKMEMLENTK